MSFKSSGDSIVQRASHREKGSNTMPPPSPRVCLPSLISVEAAVAAFSRARAPGIYKEDYLKELFRRYADEDDAPPAPTLPEWCFDDDGDGDADDDGNAVGQESVPSSSGSAPGKRKREKLKLVRLPGAPGRKGAWGMGDGAVKRVVSRAHAALRRRAGGSPAGFPPLAGKGDVGNFGRCTGN